MFKTVGITGWIKFLFICDHNVKRPHCSMSKRRPPWSSGCVTGFLSGRSEVRVTVRPDPIWNRPPYFRRGLSSKRDKSTVLIITCIQLLHTLMRVGKNVSYLPKVGGFLRLFRFPPPIKLIATLWPKVLKVAWNTSQFHPIPRLERSVTYNWIKDTLYLYKCEALLKIVWPSQCRFISIKRIFFRTKKQGLYKNEF